MPRTRVIKGIPAAPPSELQRVLDLVAADGGTAEVKTEADGTLTVTATYPDPAPAAGAVGG